MAKKGPKWIRFLRQYGPGAQNDNMYDEHIRESARRSGFEPLLFAHPIAEDLLNLFDGTSATATSVILTGTAGDGKTHLCRQVWNLLGGSSEQWESDDVYFSKEATISGETLTVHIVRDLTGLPESGRTGTFHTRTQLLERFSHTVVSGEVGSVFLIAANDGQLVDTWSRISGRARHVDDTGRLLESLLFNEKQEKTGSNLKLFNLSQCASADLFDRAVEAFLSHPGWKCCAAEADSENELFGRDCPIRRNYEVLATKQTQRRLRSLLELCDYDGIHLSIRRILMLLTNSVLGFSGAEANGVKVPDRLLRAVDVPRVVEAGESGSASFYNNVFGGNLTPARRRSHDIYEQIGRFRIGFETSNRIDNLLLYGDTDPQLAPDYDLYLLQDSFYGANERYKLLRERYVEGLEENDKQTEEFLELLVSQRRGLFFKVQGDKQGDWSPWRLTSFLFAGEYLEEILGRLRDGQQVRKSLIGRLTQGLNRIFSGMLVSSAQELWLATGLSGSNAKVSSILEDRISVSRRAREFVAISLEAGFPVLRVSLDEGVVVDLKLTLTRFEFLQRVAEGVLPSSFSRECHEDILAFKSRLLAAAKQRRREYDQGDNATEFRLLELDETGSPREQPVELS